jgi:hypothetical protein
MSKYQPLYMEKTTSFSSIFMEDREIDKADRNLGTRVSPANPIPERIPSYFDPMLFMVKNRNISHLSQGPSDGGGIKANGYKSLKYYGNGPY